MIAFEACMILSNRYGLVFLDISTVTQGRVEPCNQGYLCVDFYAHANIISIYVTCFTYLCQMFLSIFVTHLHLPLYTRGKKIRLQYIYHVQTLFDPFG